MALVFCKKNRKRAPSQQKVYFSPVKKRHAFSKPNSRPSTRPALTADSVKTLAQLGYNVRSTARLTGRKSKARV